MRMVIDNYNSYLIYSYSYLGLGANEANNAINNYYKNN